jgi:hypothetical protein
MKNKIITIRGFQVEVIPYGKIAYMYPCFNGDAEFKYNRDGYYELDSYLRMVSAMRELRDSAIEQMGIQIAALSRKII